MLVLILKIATEQKTLTGQYFGMPSGIWSLLISVVNFFLTLGTVIPIAVRSWNNLIIIAIIIFTYLLCYIIILYYLLIYYVILLYYIIYLFIILYYFLIYYRSQSDNSVKSHKTND